jgi:hypothetical protein
MVQLNGFNANEVEPIVGFEAIPAGKYVAAITESEMKPTKSGQGNYLQLTFTILEGEYRNRMLWARLNLENTNTQAVTIARSELSAICRAVGVMTPRDSSELHNLPLVISVKLRKRDDTGELTNEIKGYEAKLSTAPASRPAIPAKGATAPWAR